MSSSFDLWRVQLGNGEVVVMSLDQLDDAFQRGVVHEHTHVLREGMLQWMSLGEAAGLGVEEPVTPSAYPPPALVIDTPGPSSLRPFVSEVSDLEIEIAAGRSKKRPFVLALAAAMVLGGAGFSASRVPSVRAHVDTWLAHTRAPVANVAAAARIAAPAAPAAEVTSTATPAQGTASSRLTQEQIRALLEGDKTHAAAEQAAAKERAAKHHKARHHRHHKSHGKGTFQKGGSKYDPLNGSL